MGEGSTSLVILVVLLIILRLLNNLLKAGYFNLGQITMISMAEKAREGDGRLFYYLNNPLKLSFSAQLFDKTTLLVLVILCYKIDPLVGPVHLLSLGAYVWIFDLVIPGSLGAYKAESLVTRICPIMHFFYLICAPFIWVMAQITAPALRQEMENDEEDDPDDIKAFIKAGAEEGIIEEKEKQFLHNLLIFNDTVVREVMTPRTDMVCIEHSLSNEKVLDVFKKSKFSRLPVYRESIDRIEGVLRFKDLIELMDEHNDISSYVTDTIFVPEQKNISDLLQEMLKQRLQMAVVIDEYGGTAGLITLEDLIEEIIGEIHDEHEAPESDEIIKLKNGDVLIDGKVQLEDFCELFSTEVAAEDIDTVGGYIFNKEGRIPEEGDESMIGEIRVKISKADVRRIYQVTVTATDQEAQATA